MNNIEGKVVELYTDVKKSEQIQSTSLPQKRITVLDALRGFALLGVILIHMLQRFGIRSILSAPVDPRFPAIDEIIQWIGQNIIMGRFIKRNRFSQAFCMANVPFINAGVNHALFL